MSGHEKTALGVGPLLAATLGAGMKEAPVLIGGIGGGYKADARGEPVLPGTLSGMGGTYGGAGAGGLLGRILGIPVGGLAGAIVGSRLGKGIPGIVGGTLLGALLGKKLLPAVGRVAGGLGGYSFATRPLGEADPAELGMLEGWEKGGSVNQDFFTEGFVQAAMTKVAKQLTQRGRARISSKNFAFPGLAKSKDSKKKSGNYPIHDLPHARNALARVAQHGTSAQQAQVRAKVYAKYPQLKKASVADIFWGAFIEKAAVAMPRSKIFGMGPQRFASRVPRLKISVSKGTRGFRKAPSVFGRRGVGSLPSIKALNRVRKLTPRRI